ncbi:MAG: hypothetical protein WC554_01030 [Clostridia bacterium]|jgi:hypothetical protein
MKNGVSINFLNGQKKVLSELCSVRKQTRKNRERYYAQIELLEYLIKIAEKEN